MRSRSPTSLALRRLGRNRLAVAGALWILLVGSLALLGGPISRIIDHPPEFHLGEHKNLPPTWMTYTPEQLKRFTIDPEDIAETPQFYVHNHTSYWFGTDAQGFDLFIRVLVGGGISLKVALTGALVAVLLGVLWGSTAGFLGGWTDEVMMRLVDIFYALPYLFLVILVMSIFGQSEGLMYACLGAVSWLTMSRIVRAEVLSLKTRDFVMAARALGAGGPRLILHHMVPNMLGTIAVYATLMVPQLILTESFLSFLGLGIQAPKASWGNLIAEGASLAALEHYPWQILFSGGALSLTLLSLNFLGDGLRDALDPRSGH
ncbi:MAG: ABC transporter permease [Planctomycetota bacterium]